MPETIRTVPELLALLADSQPAHATNRERLRDMVVSLDAIAGTGVSGEAASRIAADNTLQANINTEIANRIADVDAEEAARIAAVSAEATARANADTTLQTNITAEATTRANADTTLQTNINNEATARIAGDAAANAYTDTAVAAVQKYPLLGTEVGVTNLTFPYGDVRRHGAVGDNVADDTAEIANAALSVSARVALGESATLRFPDAIGYKTTAPITLPLHAHVQMDAPVIYAGGLNEAALIYGAAGTPGVSFTRRLVLRARRSTTSTWLDEASVGVRLINCNTNDIWVAEARGFTIGIDAVGDNGGFAYNSVKLGLIADNKYGLNITNQNAGWANENDWYGGRFSCFTGTPALSRYGVRIKSAAAVYNNNNTFFKPSFELSLSQAGAGEAVPVLMEHGQQNAFIASRTENNSTVFARETNLSTENDYGLGYGSAGTIENATATYASSRRTIRRNVALERVGSLVFKSGALQKLANFSDGATSVNAPTVHIANAGSALGAAFTALSNIAVEPTYLSCTSGGGVGIFIDTKVVKSFVVRRDVESAFPGRVAVVCFDVNGAVLNSGGGGHPYVKGSSTNVPSFSANFGGCYTMGADAASDFFFQVGTDVSHIQVICWAGTSGLRIRSFSVYQVGNDGEASTWPYPDDITHGTDVLGSAVPTAGTWIQGRVIWDTTPSASGVMGWVCTTSGTLGTLNGGATTGSITSGTTALTVNSTTGLKVGQFITIAGVSGIKRVRVISGLVVTIDTNASATVSGAAVAFSAAVMKTFAAISA